MKYIQYLSFYLLLLAPAYSRKEVLTFEDNFDFLNLDNWQHEITLGGGGNWEFEVYLNQRTNSYVENGKLYLRPTYTADQIGEANLKNGYTMSLWGGAPGDYCTSNAFYGCERLSGAGGNYLNPITSARVRSVNSFSFKYGRVEFRAKLPKGDWIWPALWLLPKDNAYGNWPSSGEIDVMESRGNGPEYQFGGSDKFASTLHWGPDYWHNRYPTTTKSYQLPSGSLSDAFHTYGLYWDENTLYTYIDNDSQKVLELDFTQQSMWDRGQFGNMMNPWRGRGNSAPFDREFYIIMNVAVGGTNGYFPDGGNKPWANGDSHAVNSFWDRKGQWQNTWKGDQVAMQIDSVKVWKFDDSEGQEMNASDVFEEFLQ